MTISPTTTCDYWSGSPRTPQDHSQHDAQPATSPAPHSAQNRRSELLSWSQDGQHIADHLACRDYHDRMQTSERAAINGSGHFGRK